jgi:hypothetical protein
MSKHIEKYLQLRMIQLSDGNPEVADLLIHLFKDKNADKCMELIKGINDSMKYGEQLLVIFKDKCQSSEEKFIEWINDPYNVFS